MPHISYSALKEWVDCPWKHKINYVDGVRKFKGNEHTVFGTTLHTICETLVKTKDAAAYDAKACFQKEFLNNLQALKEKVPEFQFNENLIRDMRHQGETLTEFILPALKSYFDNFLLVTVEEALYEKIEDYDYDFKGFIDLVIKTQDGKYHIIDWKTCSWGWDNRKKTDKMTTYQLTLYKHFWCKKHGIDPTSVLTHFALLKRTAKKNNVEIFKVTTGGKKIENVLKLLHKAVYNIKKSNYVKNRLSCYGRYGICEYYKTKHCK